MIRRAYLALKIQVEKMNRWGLGPGTFRQTACCLWVIALLCAAGRCVGQTTGTYLGFSYGVSGTNIAITWFQGGGNVTIPSSIPGVNGTVTSIGDNAFYQCTGLTSVTIPNGVTNIGKTVFFQCWNLSNVVIPNSVSSLGNRVFCFCIALTNITLPAAVTNIGPDPFAGCDGLTNITVDPQNQTFSGLGGALFNKDQTVLIQYPEGLGGDCRIPGTVGAIGDFAFEYCGLLTNITIPPSVTNLGITAFGSCVGLRSITIPPSITNITLGAFSECHNLTNVSIPGSVSVIGEAAFIDCWGLTNITIPASVTTIGQDAFADCSYLTAAYFQGDAPPFFDSSGPSPISKDFTIYFPSIASGWTTPTWNGFRAQPYQSSLILERDSKTVSPAFGYLLPGTNYQLQISSDLSAWSNSGAAFTATNSSQVYSLPFGLSNAPLLFFRLQYVP